MTGEGEVTVVPDVAVLSLGVESEADTVAEAQSQASAAVNGIPSVLSSSGVEENDIKTQSYSIYPSRRWEPDTGEEELTGYRVTNMITIKVREVEDTGTIIDAVAEAGGDDIRIDGISFTVDNPAPYQKEAREKALADAREKAEQIAEAAGLELGEPTYINESGGYSPYDIAYGISVPAVESASGSSISPGEAMVTVIMQVAYSID